MISFYSGLREDLNDTLHKIIGQLVQFLLQGYITLKSDRISQIRTIQNQLSIQHIPKTIDPIDLGP